MDFNKNNNDIIDAEFVVDSTSKSQTKQNDDSDQFIKIQESDPEYSSTNERAAFKNFSFRINNKNFPKITKPSLLTVIIFSPIILFFIVFATICFLIIFILFMPKIFRLLKNRKKIFSNQNDLFKNIFNKMR